jgi:hypothetical protein
MTIEQRRMVVQVTVSGISAENRATWKAAEKGDYDVRVTRREIPGGGTSVTS